MLEVIFGAIFLWGIIKVIVGCFESLDAGLGVPYIMIYALIGVSLNVTIWGGLYNLLRAFV